MSVKIGNNKIYIHVINKTKPKFEKEYKIIKYQIVIQVNQKYNKP